MITIPEQSTKQWKQTNSGDVFGNLFSTKNIDFSQEGYLSLAQKARAYYREAAAGSDFDDVISIVFSSIGDMVFTSDEIFDLELSDTDSAPLVVNNDSGVQSPTVNGDGIAWNGRIYCTGSTATKYWDGVNWSSASIVLTSGVPHPMAVFESLNYLAVTTDANVVKLYDTSHTLKKTLTIPAEYEIRWLVYRDSNLYIGTKNKVGGSAKMFVWNGAGSSAQKSWGAKGEIMFAGCEYGNSIVTVTNLGQVLLFNGGGFNELANFPVYYSNYEWGTSAVARRGIIADGEKLYINIQGEVRTQNRSVYLQGNNSGLWCYDPKIGLYHRGSNSSDYPTYATVTAVNTTTDVVTIDTAVETQTGEPIVYSQNTSAIGGITSNRLYYAIRVTSTTFKFAETYDNAITGTQVNLTSDPGTYTGKLVCPKGGDFGDTFNSDAGAVAIIPSSKTSYDFLATKILYGAGGIFEDEVTTEYSTLMTFVPGENRGNFVTQKIYSTDIEDVWNKAILKTRNILNTNDKVIVKYRTSEKQFYPISPFTFQLTAVPVTWASTSSFTVTSTKWANVAAGEEVEILSGAGAGYTAHISTISNNGGTYTVTIDETLPLITANDVSYVVVNNWTKGATLTSSDISLHKTTPIGSKAKWIQIKCELRGEGTQVEEIQMVNKKHLPTV